MSYSPEVEAEIRKLLGTERKVSVVARAIINKFDLDKSYDTVWKKVDSIRKSTSSISESRSLVNEEKKRVLSAWNDEGYMMDIDQYCSHYQLPRADVKSYKLVSHTGTPYYNILFKEHVEVESVSVEETINNLLEHLPEVPKVDIEFGDITDRLVYTDVHVAMETTRGGLALYGVPWDKDVLNDRIDEMVNIAIQNKQSPVLIVDELGDFMDGWDAMTTRKSHMLPQNMTNEEAYDVGVSAKVRMANALSKHWDCVVFNNICEDNHSGAFGYIVNSGFKGIVDVTLSNVIVNNHRKFLNHYFVGDHAFVITHGKDSRNLKFGFKPNLDPAQIEKLDQYMKHEGIYKKAEFVEVTKGDSHQFLYDVCSSDDFEYLNVMAFSPSSEWVQTNFKKGRSGFLMQHIYNNTNRKDLKTFWFNQ